MCKCCFTLVDISRELSRTYGRIKIDTAIKLVNQSYLTTMTFNDFLSEACNFTTSGSVRQL